MGRHEAPVANAVLKPAYGPDYFIKAFSFNVHVVRQTVWPLDCWDKTTIIALQHTHNGQRLLLALASRTQTQRRSNSTAAAGRDAPMGSAGS